MHAPFALLRAVGKAVLNAVGGGVAGDVVLEVIPEIAHDVFQWWRKKQTLEECHEELQALAAAAAQDVREAAQKVVAEIAGDAKPEVQAFLTRYLSQVPAAVRQSMRGSVDAAEPLPDLSLFEEADDLISLLPSHLPRFQPGDRPLSGIDWELVELLGVGGFGEVWKAKNPHFDGVPPVALKFCLDPDARDRLLRHEAAVLNQLMRQGRHAGIVALQHTYLSADPPCLEYEYVAGGDLCGLIQHERRQSPGPARAERAARLMLDLASTVAFAHGLTPPIVHRDLKPANILVQRGEDGQATLRIADFGIGGIAAGQMIARSRMGTSQGGFLVSALRGAHTPLYASPQQMRGAAPDVRDDVHALGVIWYQLATGNLAAGRPGGSRWTQRLADLGLTSGMIDLLGACAEEDAVDRPANAAVVAQRLEELVGRPAVKVVPRPERRAPMPRNLPKTLTNSLGMKFVLIPEGTYVMGAAEEEGERGEDEGPRHTVQITRPYYLGVYPVTQKDYQTVMGENPAQFRKGQGGGVNHPVDQVSWKDASEFCRRLAALSEEKDAGRVYRLPTEAEWEYACRAGSETAFAFGATLSASQANFDGRHPVGAVKPQSGPEKTTKVGAYKPNAWGLYDMHGNVWEWCQDWYDKDYYRRSPERDPEGPARGEHRVLRGGSWNNSGHLCRSARRNKRAPDSLNETVGFRIVLGV